MRKTINLKMNVCGLLTRASELAQQMYGTCHQHNRYLPLQMYIFINY